MASTQPPQPASAAETFSELFGSAVDNIVKVIQGKRDAVELILTALVAEGHLLIEDVPGVGKTSLAKAVATTISCSTGRIQFTPDLLPSDVVGVSIYRRSVDRFEFQEGPIFANLVLGDEINRASPKTQSALLEAMGERQVTVDGSTHPLPSPFMVIATQNPVEHEGTFPLPESQLDRFLMMVTLGYPDRTAEIEVLDNHGNSDALADIGPVLTAEDVLWMIDVVKAVHVAPSLKGYIVDIAAATRSNPAVALGMSPRATLALQRAAKARAAASGREYVVPDDIKAMAGSVIAHRIVIAPEASMQGVTPLNAVDAALSSAPVPTSRA